jgi:GMP synthase-like glutamine amidotransferase
MRVLIIAHDHVSPPGPVAERFRHHGFEVDEFLVVSEADYAEPNVVREFPNLADYDVIVPMGAPWGAWDDERIGNWLEPELEFLTKAITQDTPIFGICFGGQLLARALGGNVAPGPKPEIGWTVVHTDRPDLVSAGPWFQFHYDRWQLPLGATEIARNPAASQAFLINNSMAVQFHPELNAAGLKGWLDWGGDKKVIQDGQDPVVMLRQTEAEEADARARTFALVDAFIDQVSGL